MADTPLWLRLDSPAAAADNTGGKGFALSTMARAGLPVPRGFHLTTAAYRHFTDDPDLHHRLRAIVTGADADDPAAVADASRRITALLAERPVPVEVTEAIAEAYATMDGARVAVRSSATAEDLPGASFAGQMESYLNIHGAEAVAEAVKRCWISLWTGRAIEYRARTGLAAPDVAMAVVVQELVDASAAGVVFTADPVTGARDRLVINAAWGLGESVVGGTVTADTITVDSADGSIIDRHIADKTVMTVRDDHGTREIPVPESDRNAAVMDDAAAARLAALAARVVQLYRRPMDIEWATRDGDFALVQARPITNLKPPPVTREEWNDSLTGDFLWTSSNVGEAVPSVMTPISWSLAKRNLADAMAIPGVGEHDVCGNIGGRLYINYSVVMGTAKAVGMGRVMKKAGSLSFGEVPDDMQVPPIPLSRWKILRSVLPAARRFSASVKTYQRDLDTYVAQFPGRCDAARSAIAAARNPAALVTVFRDHCEPLINDAPRMLAAGGRVNGMVLATLRPWLREFVDDADANALVTGAHTANESLASLGPLLGLRQLADGSIDAETYIATWGHRCPDELELSAPRPAEDPGWLEARLAGLADAPDVDEMLARQTAHKEATIQRFVTRYPSKATTLRRKMAAAAEAMRAREATRSESVRCCWVVRDFLLRCGEVTGADADVFFLDFAELMRLVDGDATALSKVAARRAAYEHYRSLPVYPTWIRGHFDPEKWAADARRRHDRYDATAPHPARTGAIVGTPGSTGVVEATARVITDMDQARRLDVGDILVTKITNIGWTPIFPRIAAVVTDIGATLSHASIVARELGIPAVVGCGDATVRINDGDKIRVDGGTGTVEILSQAPRESGTGRNA